MSFDTLRRAITRRLDQADRGDRGWFIITRVHLSAARLRDTCSYLDAVGAHAPYAVTDSDYAALAQINGVASADPWVELHRHHFLAMESPLQLVRRSDARRWNRVELTTAGVELARSQDTSGVLERALSEITFCRPPWYLPGRVQQYKEFDVRPFATTRSVMRRCGGWIDRDEYDLFVSRVRREREVQWAVAGVLELRRLTDTQRDSLLQEVRRRIPSPKTYQNWRDSALHTFSLFGLSASMLRTGDRLVLSRAVVQPGRRTTRRAVRRAAPSLQLPEPPKNPALSSPPVVPAVNPGTDGELLVGKLLAADGWQVVYYSMRRGFGFDIWAKREDQVMLVEVKSSLQSVGSITLTDLEYQAARTHRRNYVLAIVEKLGSDAPSVAFVQDPARALRVQAAKVSEYRIARADWLAAATPVGLQMSA